MRTVGGPVIVESGEDAVVAGLTAKERAVGVDAVPTNSSVWPAEVWMTTGVLSTRSVCPAETVWLPTTNAAGAVELAPCDTGAMEMVEDPTETAVGAGCSTEPLGE